MQLELIRAEYDKRQQQFELLSSRARQLTLDSITRNKIKFHTLSHRIKTLDSILGKMRRKQLTNPFNELTDIVGLRIVCLFIDDIPKIAQVMESTFDVTEAEDKIGQTEINVFGYFSYHAIAKLKGQGDSNNAGLAGMPFEIQIRTISQDAWASVSHYLDYKVDATGDFPDEARREFNALSALFYIADRQFLQYRKERFSQTP